MEAGVAPADAFSLVVSGHALAATSRDGWAGVYHVPAGTGTLNARLVVRRFPWNGILAGTTLFVWVVMWLGFGWVSRLEWLFVGRRRGRRARGRRREGAHRA